MQGHPVMIICQIQDERKRKKHNKSAPNNAFALKQWNNIYEQLLCQAFYAILFVD